MNDETTEQTENRLIAERREKLGELRSRGNAFPNDFRRDAVAGELHAGYDGHTNESLEEEGFLERATELLGCPEAIEPSSKLKGQQ